MKRQLNKNSKMVRAHEIVLPGQRAVGLPQLGARQRERRPRPRALVDRLVGKKPSLGSSTPIEERRAMHQHSIESHARV